MLNDWNPFRMDPTNKEIIGVKGGGAASSLNSLERNPKEREREDFRNRAVPMPTAVPDPAGIQ